MPYGTQTDKSYGVLPFLSNSIGFTFLKLHSQLMNNVLNLLSGPGRPLDIDQHDTCADF